MTIQINTNIKSNNIHDVKVMITIYIHNIKYQQTLLNTI